VLSLTQPGDWVFDPFLGAGTAVASAVMRGRRGCGSEMLPEYVAIARERAALALRGALPVRPMNRPVFDASKTTVSAPPAHWRPQSEAAAWRQGTLDEDVQAAQQSLT
jgi:adenine-specific DNA-methyltransferase